MSKMSRSEENEMIGQLAIETWEVWEKAGWLKGLEAELGPLTPKERIVFQNAWKLGFSYSVQMGRSIAEKIRSTN